MSPKDKHDGWVGFMIQRPIAIFTLLLTIAVLGLIAYSKIPVQLLPAGWGAQFISLSIPYMNSSPYETLEKITRLVEEEIETIPGVVRVHSTSSEDYAQLQIEFSGTADMDLAYAEIRDRMERVRPRLPNGADRYFIWRFNLDDSFPVIAGGMLFDLDSSEDKINYLAEDVIRKQIESVDGVARMRIHGLLDPSIRILLDEDRIRAARLDLYELVTRLGKDNFALPVGKIEEGGSRYLLRVNAKYSSLEEIRDLPVNAQLRIRDIGEVKYVQSVRNELSRIDGKFALYAEVSKNSGANSVDVCKRINASIQQLERRGDLAGFKFLKFFDQGQMIAGSLRNLGDSAIWGGIYAVLVLFVFLHRLRLTLLVALAIPLSVLMTLIVQHFSGNTFNMLSMMGMTIGIGMLVDNAIVVVENIFRLRQEGLSFRDAAIRGTQEVGLAITLSTFTSIVVFFPLMFMSEQKNLRIAFKAIGMPLSVSLLASLVVALIFIPAAIYHLQGDRASRTEKIWGRLPSVMPRLIGGIQAILRWTLKHRVAAFFILIGLLMTMQWPVSHLPKAAGKGDMGLHFHVEIDLPRNMLLSEASDEIQHYEDFLATKKQEYKFENVSVDFDRLRGELTLWYEKPLPIDEFRAITKKVADEIPKRPGNKIGLRTHLGSEGGEASSGIQLILSGKDPQLLADLGKQVERRLETLPELTSVRSGLEKGREEVRVKLDREKTNMLSLSPEMVSGVVEWGLRGFSLPRYQEEDREIPFIIQLNHGADESLNNLRDLRIMAAGQKDVSLASIANFTVDKGYGEIYRRDGKTILNVRADTNEKDLSLLWPKIKLALANIQFPPGYGWFEEGGLQQWNEDASEIGSAAILSIVLVFFLMGILFESWILPISILFTLPTAAFGGFWLLYLSNTALDQVGMIGFVVLVGVVVNNGILLIDHINRLRAEGMTREEAIEKGCADRLRPILMTAMTTIVGLLPMAITESNPQEGISYNTLAVTIIGGLSVSTLFTLWVVPLFYTFVEDLSLNVRKALKMAASRPIDSSNSE